MTEEDKVSEQKSPEGKAPEPDLPGRIDGLRGWLEEIERRQGRMTYFGGAATLVALITSGAALLIGIGASNDSASKDDLDEVKAQITQLQTQVQAATGNTKKLEALGDQLTAVQQQIRTVRTAQARQASAIAGLESQAAKPAPAGQKP